MNTRFFWRVGLAFLLSWSAFFEVVTPNSALAQMAAACDIKFQGSMVGYWNFDNLLDRMEPVYGNVRGTVVGTNQHPYAGVVRHAFEFDGHTYIDFGTTLNVPAWEQYTVSIWFLNNGSSPPAKGYGQKIIDKTTWFSDFYLAVNTFVEPPHPLIYNYAENFANIADRSYDYLDYQWHHAVMVKNGVHAELWVDGVRKASADNAKLVDNNQPLLLGYSLSPDSFQRQYWGGALDEFAIFNQALSSEQIVDLYETSLARNDYCTFDVSTPQLVASLPPTNGRIVDRIEALKGLTTSPNELVLAARNQGANCGTGPAPTIWKAYFDPATKDLLRVERKADLSAIQIVRDLLFEASDGTLFTASGICGYLPAYYSTDHGESWQRADSGAVHPPNSTFSYAEFQGKVYLGTGYEPYNGELYRWLGNGNWERVFDLGPVRNIVGTVITFDEQLFVGATNYGIAGRNCSGSVPVYRTHDGVNFEPTTGIPDCEGVTKLVVVENGGTEQLLAVTVNADIPDTYFFYRWNRTTESWERIEQLMYMKYGQPVVVRMHLLPYRGAIYSFGRPLGEAEQALYMTTDLGRTWQQIKDWAPPPVFSVDFYDEYLYLGTARDSNNLAYLYRYPVEHLPVRINDQLQLTNIGSGYDRTPAPDAPAGTYGIGATFKNISTSRLQETFFRVTTLTGGNLLLNATSGQRGEGAVVAGPAQIRPGDTFDISFRIGLRSTRPFTFKIDVYGVPIGGLNNAALLGSMQPEAFGFAVEENAFTEPTTGEDKQIYLPLIVQ